MLAICNKKHAKIDEKSLQMGGNIGPKSRKSGAGGTPKGRQEAKMKKRGVPLTRPPYF